MTPHRPALPDPAAVTLATGPVVLRSAFQPIYSFSHQRLVGHEALVRAADPAGRPIAPQALFDRCADVVEVRRLDKACCVVHADGFARAADGPQWLFLNVDAGAIDVDDDPHRSVGPIRSAVERAGLRPSQVAIEVLETALPDDAAFDAWTGELKRLGFVVALDDFGAGHSNFDRVFRLRPHIVKLDRSVVARSVHDRSGRRVMAQMIALLHECGAQVLVEGVESAAEASIALDSDADFVQGFHFGRPDFALRRAGDASGAMGDVWATHDERARAEVSGYAKRVEPYARALLDAKARLEAGESLRAACASYLRLEHADLCYLLDERGMQVDDGVLYKTAQGVAPTIDAPYAPLLDTRGARWSRRPYFRSALAAPGRMQVTRPYPTMHSPLLSVTLSVALRIDGAVRVLCGDKLWIADDDAGPRLRAPRAAEPTAADDAASFATSTIFPLHARGVSAEMQVEAG